ncbi:NmrA domain-containing protein [Favolaschia claudopus]|uniref:NmrA domain-containing protein n=1 Tax=Favolaschia claudopus TaxID=2862362 RepID=A0AAV9Z3D3_9AGAR
MTISQDSFAPLVAVVGATGVQGGSVIKALLDSRKAYRIRAFTRDPTKPAAQTLAAQGVEVVSLSIGLGNEKDVVNAFTGADIIFETAEGKMMIDAAKSAGVTRIIWSGLPNCAKISNGKYIHGVHFDGKAVVSEYGRQCGVPFVDVQCGYYANDMLSPKRSLIQRKEDGSFEMIVPVDPETVLPIIDAVGDYGLYVRQVIEASIFPNGEEFRTGEYLTLREIAAQVSQATGKRIVVEQIPLEMFRAAIATKMPPHIVLDFCDVWKCTEEFGFYGGKSISGLEGERQPVTLKAFAAAADWSQVLA